MTTDPKLVHQLDGRIAEVRERIASAAVAVGRDPESVTLIAVSKTHPWATIAAAAKVGQRDFGENRLE
ncbi:MAG TPA: YggS family pyridoxal phosphate-dependent enzyme, partial [Anaerolineales bacterium]|nr:YggS family pyridoxal phosphate-dependent enzyme [Anaerolineales bacterium]